MRFSEYFSIVRSDTDDWFDIDLSVDSPYLCDPYTIVGSQDEGWAHTRSHLTKFLIELNNTTEGYFESGGSRPGNALRAMLAMTEPIEYRLGFPNVEGNRGFSRGNPFGGLKLPHLQFVADMSDQDKAIAILKQLGSYDRLSDIALNVIKFDMIEYTQSVGIKHQLSTRPVSVQNYRWNEGGRHWENAIADLPIDEDGVPVILVPEYFIHAVHRRLVSDFREREFVEFLFSLLVGSSIGLVSKDVRLGSRAMVDLVVAADSDVYLVECKKSIPQTEARVAELIERIQEYKDLAESGIYANKSLHLVVAIPGTLSIDRIQLLREKNIAVWDASWIAHLATRENLSKEAVRFIGDEVKAEAANEPIALSDRLSATSPGRSDWVKYQRLCQDIFEYLFCPPLRSPLQEHSNLSGANRRDFILPNYSVDGFWASLRQQYKADFIVVDAKNHTERVDKDAVLQIANYLSRHGVGLFSIIICRVGANSAALTTIREQWERHDKMILILQDEDLLQMLTHKASGGDPVEMIVQKVEDFRLSL